MQKDNYNQFIEGFRKPMFLLGLLLTGFGCLILLYIGLLVVQMINNPLDLKIVTLILEQIKPDGPAIFGSFGDTVLDINISETVKLVIFVFLGLFLISAVSNIVHVLIKSGISIISAASIKESVKKENTDSNANINKH